MAEIIKKFETGWMSFVLALVIIGASTWLLIEGAIEEETWKWSMGFAATLYMGRTIASKLSPKSGG